MVCHASRFAKRMRWLAMRRTRSPRGEQQEAFHAIQAPAWRHRHLGWRDHLSGPRRPPEPPPSFSHRTLYLRHTSLFHLPSPSVPRTHHLRGTSHSARTGAAPTSPRQVQCTLQVQRIIPALTLQGAGAMVGFTRSSEGYRRRLLCPDSLGDGLVAGQRFLEP